MSEVNTALTTKNGAMAPARWRFTPNVDVHESGEQYLIQLDVPGVNAASIDVRVIGTTLHVRAEQTRTDSQPGAAGAAFERQIELPGEVDADSASAKLSNGVLEIRIAKARAARRIKIPVGSN